MVKRIKCIYVFGANYQPEIGERDREARGISRKYGGKPVKEPLLSKLPKKIRGRDLLRFYRSIRNLFQAYGEMREEGISFSDKDLCKIENGSKPVLEKIIA